MTSCIDRMSIAEYRGHAKAPTPLEEEECAWLYKWARVTRWRGRPIAEVLIHVPNGAYLGKNPVTRAITMGKLKAMGVQPGVYDYIVPVPLVFTHGVTPGLWLEMKRIRGGRTSTEQKAFRARMIAFGWRCEVAKGWVAASKIIENHLEGAT